MVGKEKSPCPASGESRCADDCLCRGRGFVRAWTLIMEFDAPLPRVLKAPPAGVEASAVFGSYDSPVLVVKISRYQLSHAMDDMSDYLFSATGLKPLLRSAW